MKQPTKEWLRFMLERTLRLTKPLRQLKQLNRPESSLNLPLDKLRNLQLEEL